MGPRPRHRCDPLPPRSRRDERYGGRVLGYIAPATLERRLTCVPPQLFLSLFLLGPLPGHMYADLRVRRVDRLLGPPLYFASLQAAEEVGSEEPDGAPRAARSKGAGLEGRTTDRAICRAGREVGSMDPPGDAPEGQRVEPPRGEPRAPIRRRHGRQRRLLGAPEPEGLRVARSFGSRRARGPSGSSFLLYLPRHGKTRLGRSRSAP